MASTQSLLGLVSQLQNMETCFTSILMEGAMKLSALSDAKIFILVETAEGRRFCGKRHLCDQYIRGGGLAPIGNDLELDVDTSVSAIRERTSVFQAQEHVQVEETAVPPPTTFHVSPLTPRDPQSARVPSQSTTIKSRKRSSTQNGASSPSKRAKENKEIVNLKTEIAFDANDGVGLFGADEDGVDEVHVQLIPGPNDASGGLLSLINGSDIADCAEQSLAAYEENMPNLPEIPHDKLMALQCVAPADCLTKGTVGFKLLNSVLYDLGKRIAHICCRKGFLDSKDPRAKAQFSSYFDAWVNEHLRHLMDQGLKIFDGNQNRSALGFMKYITRTNFNSTMKGFISVKRLS